jgi:copper chaperone NosL
MKALKTAAVLLMFLVAACSREEARPLPVEFQREHSCKVCGMIIVDFPGAKAQMRYKKGKGDAFCSTLDMFHFYLQPDRPANIAAIYVNDMGKADHDHPKGNWIDAKSALYVVGGDVMGPMGEALVPFSDPKDADAYIKKHGGRIVKFDEVTIGMLTPKMKQEP